MLMLSSPSIAETDTVHAYLDRARRWCALSEQCESGVRQKLISWGATPVDVELIIVQLRAEDYLNDVRYARAFCESKLVGQRWGRQKVLYQLRSKHLPKEAIEEGMSTVDDETYFRIMSEEKDKKLRTLGGEMTPDVQRRLLSFLASRGYSASEISHLDF